MAKISMNNLAICGIALAAILLQLSTPISSSEFPSQLRHKKPTKPTHSCDIVKCSEGHECDPLNGKCVAVDCSASDACEESYVCVPEERFCIRAPCPQFRCDPGCALVDCFEGHECDQLNGQCVAVDCSAEDACPDGTTCVPEERFCIRAPCPQFTCEPDTDDCVVCTLMEPSCEEDCKSCHVFPQTCNSCASAVCLDEYCQEDCVVCPLIFPECDEECHKCLVHGQTCTSCAFAECLDE